MEFFDTIRQVQSNWQPYKKWEIEQQKKEKQNEELRKKYPPTPQELEHAKQYGRTIVTSINTMDQHSIDKSEDASVVIGYYMLPLITVLTSLGLTMGRVLNKMVSKSRFKAKFADYAPYSGLIGMIVVDTIAMPIINIWQSKIMKQSSRVARFQTRENELKDPRNFVIYNEKQIQEAEKIAMTLPEVKENRQDKFSKDIFNPLLEYKQTKKTTDALKKDDAKYQEWKKEYLKEEEKKKEYFKTLNPSKEDLSKAEKDRDAMLNTIKKIETSSLNYLNNMDMATTFLSAVILTGGTAVGMGLLGLIETLQKNKKLPNSKGLSILKYLSVTMLPLIPQLIIIAPTNKLIKDAARIGRFKAKQELLNNPQNFIAYDDEQRKTISKTNQKEPQEKPKGFFARLKQDMKDIKQLKNDYTEYQNYMNTEHKKELKIQEALKQIKISDEQKTDAVKLQKQAFHSFEKMDEKAQRFTDDTDAAVDTTRQTINSIISLVLKLTSVYIAGKEIKRINGGKIPENIFKALELTFSGKLKGKALVAVLLPFVIPPFTRISMVIKGIQIKKDAGKIGVMTAMQDLDDPKNFLDEKQNKKS